jgi:hypothetical protein
MKTQQMVQGALKGRRAIPQHGWGLVLGAVLIGLLAVLYFANLSGPGPANTSSSAALRLEPGARSVADYLRAHSSIPEHAAPNPAAQSDPALPSVLNYIRVHESVPDSVILELYRAHADRKD